MKFRAPLYYKKFHCIADKCKDSCCSAGWEIDIDSETAEFYSNVEGEFGDKLHKNISATSPCHFVLDNHNNCPFLNDKKLCDIYINLGEEHLCQICKDHPRYYEWFDDNNIKEAGIGLCCEEAARIILCDEDKFGIYEDDDVNSKHTSNCKNDEKSYDDVVISNTYDSRLTYNHDLYDYLFSARNKILTYLDNTSIPLMSKIRNILWYGHTLQQDIDYDLLDDEDIFDVSITETSSIKNIINYIASLEPNDSNWPVYLKKCSLYEKEFKKNLQQFESSNPIIEKYLKNISSYFIWRYFLKATFDEDVLSKVKLMYVSINVLKYLFFCKWFEEGKLDLEDCIWIVKKYSEEVEYCEDNLFKFAGDSYELGSFETEYLLGL
jgi:lysine-N-methylase